MMSETETIFRVIADELIAAHDAVTLGRMMSSPAITRNNKVFAFYHADAMVFKLGEDFEPKSAGISSYELLSPFKNKPPMRAWFRIPDQSKWTMLAEEALNRMVTEQSK
jgi:hypothetical protein